MAISAGQLIWTSFRPLIRLIINVAAGFFLTRAELFPSIAARGAGQIILNVTIPALMFSKIVPSFNSDNVSALGPLVLVAVLYIILGILLAWLVRTFFWVPHRFRYGILVAGGWSNWGDIPTAVAMSICGSAPFRGEEDQTLAVAYVAVFILVFQLTLFPMGTYHLVAKDYAGPDVEDEDVRLETAQRRNAILRGRWSILIPNRKSNSVSENIDTEKTRSTPETKVLETPSHEVDNPIVQHLSSIPDATRSSLHTRHVAFSDLNSGAQTPTAFSPGPSRAQSPAPKDTNSTPTPHQSSQILHHLTTFAKSIASPPSASVILALIIALVQPLKALFVPVPTIHLHPAPDGEPPLAVLLDTAGFIGAGSVPLGLICLGGALARLPVPRTKEEWGRLPSGAILGLAVAKELVLPVVGVAICQGLTSAGVIRADDKVLRFVCMFFSCLPTATTQVYLTQVASGTGDSGALAAFLIPQYVLMMFSMTGLTAYAVGVLF